MAKRNRFFVEPGLLGEYAVIDSKDGQTAAFVFSRDLAHATAFAANALRSNEGLATVSSQRDALDLRRNGFKVLRNLVRRAK